MAILKRKASRKLLFSLGLLLLAGGMSGHGVAAYAQAPAAVPPQVGTVKAISGTSLTVATDAGPTVTLVVPDAAVVKQLPAGSTDMKAAAASQFSSISVGDRVLASVKAGDTPTSFTVRTVIVTKAGEIAQKNAADQADWKKNGTAGLVASVGPAPGTVTVTEGTKKVVVTTSTKTNFLRFNGDSAKFQDAKPGTADQIHAGDQIQARGVKSADGLSVQADEVLSGSFKNLSGVIASIDPATGKITLKDLATKKMYSVEVTANSDVRKMPLQQATAYAARTNGGAAPARGGRGGGAPAPAPDPSADPGAGAGGRGGPGGRGGAGGGGDLASMIPRMPTGTLADLKKGDAVMVVATEPTPGATDVTAVTLLSGVEPILTANPNGGMSLSMGLGGGGGGGD